MPKKWLFAMFTLLLVANYGLAPIAQLVRAVLVVALLHKDALHRITIPTAVSYNTVDVCSPIHKTRPDFNVMIFMNEGKRCTTLNCYFC